MAMRVSMLVAPMRSQPNGVADERPAADDLDHHCQSQDRPPGGGFLRCHKRQDQSSDRQRQHRPAPASNDQNVRRRARPGWRRDSPRTRCL